MLHFLFLLLLFRNPADRKEKRKIDKEHRIGRKKKKKKTHAKWMFVKVSTELRKIYHTNKKVGKDKKTTNKNKT